MDDDKAKLVVVVVGEGPREETSEGQQKHKMLQSATKTNGRFELYLGQMLCGGETSGLIRGRGGDTSSKWKGFTVCWDKLQFK